MLLTAPRGRCDGTGREDVTAERREMSVAQKWVTQRTFGQDGPDRNKGGGKTNQAH